MVLASCPRCASTLWPLLRPHAEHRVRQSFDDGALHLDDAVLLGHVLRQSVACDRSGWSGRVLAIPKRYAALAWAGEHDRVP